MAKKTLIVYTHNDATLVKKYDTISNAVAMLTTISKNDAMCLLSVVFPDWYKLPAHSSHLIQKGVAS